MCLSSGSSRELPTSLALSGIGWGAYCVGLLFFYLGSAGLGLVLLRLRELRLPGTLMLAWLPTGVLLLVLGSLLGAPGLGGLGLSVAVGICGVSYVLLGLRLSEVCKCVRAVE